jgi:hypothetical protein
MEETKENPADKPKEEKPVEQAETTRERMQRERNERRVENDLRRFASTQEEQRLTTPRRYTSSRRQEQALEILKSSLENPGENRERPIKLNTTPGSSSISSMEFWCWKQGQLLKVNLYAEFPA